jgi:hypothetical protein
MHLTYYLKCFFNDLYFSGEEKYLYLQTLKKLLDGV